MTDGLNAVLSNDRAASTDTNRKILDLAYHRSVTATRLEQLLYSTNCYIQIFRINFFPAVGIKPATYPHRDGDPISFCLPHQVADFAPHKSGGSRVKYRSSLGSTTTVGPPLPKMQGRSGRTPKKISLNFNSISEYYLLFTHIYPVVTMPI